MKMMMVFKGEWLRSGYRSKHEEKVAEANRRRLPIAFLFYCLLLHSTENFFTQCFLSALMQIHYTHTHTHAYHKVRFQVQQWVRVLKMTNGQGNRRNCKAKLKGIKKSSSLLLPKNCIAQPSTELG